MNAFARHRRALLCALAGTPLVARASIVRAGEGRLLRAGPDNYRAALTGLRTGDTLRLSPGEYRQGLPLHGLQGTAAAPITIEGPRGGGAVFVGRPRHNTVSIVDSAHVHVRDLTLEGRRQPVDAVKAEGHARFAHHIVLQRLRIVGHGVHQSLVGISTKCPAWGWQILENMIVGAGTGMYLGNSDGSAPFWDGLIAGNRILDPVGYGLQIKHQVARPVLDEAPAEAARTVIRGNVIVKSAGASTGKMARPNLLLGHFPLAGAGSEDLYLVYGNLLYDNPTEALMQAEGNVAIYNGIFVNRFGDAIRVMAHVDRPRRVAVFHNTVVARGRGIEISGGAPGYERVARGNLVFAGEPVLGETPADGNVVRPFGYAQRDLIAPLAPLASLDLTPRAVDGLGLASLPKPLLALPSAEVDFRGLRRTSGVAGACIEHDAKARPCQ